MEDCIRLSKKWSAARWLRPLTSDAARQLGHVLWIETNDPREAYRQIHDEIQPGQYNAAVWADAGKLLQPGFTEALRAFREKSHFKWPQDYRTDSDNPRRSYNKEDLRRLTPERLGGYFNALALGNADDEVAVSMIRRLHQNTAFHADALLDSMPIANLGQSLRGDGQTAPYRKDLLHTDGNIYDRKKLRWLQSLACPATVLISNTEAKRVKGTSNTYILRSLRDATLWQVPENSVLVLTNEGFDGQPILHGEAPTLPGQKPIPRSLMVMELYL